MQSIGTHVKNLKDFALTKVLFPLRVIGPTHYSVSIIQLDVAKMRLILEMGPEPVFQKPVFAIMIGLNRVDQQAR